jgi:glyoxylase-like metal-dependent hydrolase (beta-lactamase superfamily II)
MYLKYITAIFTLCLLLTLNLAKAYQLSVNANSSIDDKYQLSISQIADNVYQHISYKKFQSFGIVPASGLIVLDGKNAHIIDTPWTEADTEKLVVWIKSQGLTPKSSISTHFHDDRAGGIPYLNKLSIDTYASKLTNHLLTNKNKQAAKHDLMMDNNAEGKLALANGAIEVFYPGAGHSRDNIVVWLPEHELLFGGCFVKSLSSKTLGYTGDADIAQWPVSMQKLINKYPTVKQVVPGHGEIGDNKLLIHSKTLALKVGNEK